MRFRFFDQWLRPSTSDFPIGIDFGSRSIKLAQAAVGEDGATRLAAATSIDLPAERHRRLITRLDTLRAELSRLLESGTFAGTDAVVALPASWLTVHRLRVPMSVKADEVGELVRSELTDHLPATHPRMLVRHVVAGEVYHGQELRREVIGVTAPRGSIDALVAAAAKAGLSVVAMPSEAQALANWQLIERREAEGTNATGTNRATMIIDLGHRNARVYVARGQQILFARAIASRIWTNSADATTAAAPGAALTPRVDTAAGIALIHAPTGQRLRKSAAQQAQVAQPAQAKPTESAPPPPRPALPPANTPRDPAQLIQEIRQSCRYFETTFPQVPLDRVLFVGGAAIAQPGLCRDIANVIDLPAQVANPFARLGSSTTLTSLFSAASGNNASGPAFAVAIALAVGGFTKVPTVGAAT